MHSYQPLLAKNRIQQRVSRKGKSLDDNATIESFFERMNTEHVYGKTLNILIDSNRQSMTIDVTIMKNEFN